MTFEEFCEKVKDEIVSRLPSDWSDAEVFVRKTEKARGSYTALSVLKKGSRTAPSVSLDEYYCLIEKGSSFGKVMDLIASQVSAPVGELSVDWITDYEAIKDRLFLRLNSRANLDGLRETAPLKELAGLPVTASILVNSDEHTLGSTLVTYELLGEYGVTEEEIFERALENSPRIFPSSISTLAETLNEMGTEALSEETSGAEGMLVVTNDKKVNGASVLLYPGILEALSERMGGSYIVIPSSIHEVLIVKGEEPERMKEISETVKRVNACCVAPSERLADCAFFYDGNDHILRAVEA